MVRRRLLISALTCVALALAGTAEAGPPKPAPSIFVSSIYALTLAVPSGATYCPLPDDWSGSDHGTTIFLTPPRHCGNDTGYSSDARSYLPQTTPHIHVFYVYGPDEPHLHCQSVGHVRFLDHDRPLCRETRGQAITVSVSGEYMSDGLTAAVITLVTTPKRLARDLKTFKALAASTRACLATVYDSQGGSFMTGNGTPCPSDGASF